MAQKRTSKSKSRARKVLVIDIGGTNVKLYGPGMKEPLKIPSGPKLTPTQMVAAVKQATKDWKFDVISIGYPGPMVRGKPLRDPYNLGKGWVAFEFRKAFGKPVQIINDAAMQALGSYKGGRMLFLGLGTGLGSAMVADGILEPMEIAHMPYKKGKTYEDFVGAAALEKHGKKKWAKRVTEIVEVLKNALQPDYVVLGGGNAKKLPRLPDGSVLGANENAGLGGRRLWQRVGAGSIRV
jgi:predicted NBD/HSP70 family sugar kinase